MKHLTLFAVAALAFAADSNWPQFRGAGASGIGNGAAPLQWDGEKGENILWKTEIPGLGHSSPVIWGDRIFVTSAVPASGEASLKVGLYGNIQPVEGEGPQAFMVYCLDRKSGKILWQRAAVSGQPKIKRHPKSTHANPTPATDGKTLVVSFGSEGLFALDLDGKQLWKKDFGILDSGFYMVPAAQWGFASSPVIHCGSSRRTSRRIPSWLPWISLPARSFGGPPAATCPPSALPPCCPTPPVARTPCRWW